MKGLLLLFVLAGACNTQEHVLDGAYENIVQANANFSSQGMDTAIHNISIFKNGYWINTCFMKGYIFECCGGTYKKINDKYIRTFNFNSLDKTVIGRTDTFSYTFKDDMYLIKNFNLNTTNIRFYQDEYYKINTSDTLKNSFLEGVWLMTSGQAGYTTNSDVVIRIYAYPCFTRTFYNLEQRKFRHTEGGTYQFDGKNVIEKIEYTTGDIAWGSTIEWNVKKFSDSKILLFDIDSHYDEEIYEKVK